MSDQSASAERQPWECPVVDISGRHHGACPSGDCVGGARRCGCCGFAAAERWADGFGPICGQCDDASFLRAAAARRCAPLGAYPVDSVAG